MRKFLGFGVSFALLIWLGWSVNWSEVGSALVQMHLWAIVPGLFLLALQMYARGLRWRYLLPTPEQEVSTRVLVDSLFIGNLASCVLPLRMGEFVRPLVLSLQSQWSFSSAFASVVVERFFDLSAVLITFGLILPFIEGVPSWAEQGALLLSIMAGCIVPFLVLGSFFPEQLLGALDRLTRPVPHRYRSAVLRFLRELLAGAAVLREPKRLIMVILLTCVVWGSTALLYHTFTWLFEINVSLAFAPTTMVFVALAVAAPSAPGFIGVYQAGCMASFGLFGLDPELGAAFSLVTHVLQYLPIALYGAYALSRTEWTLGDLVRKQNTH